MYNKLLATKVAELCIGFRKYSSDITYNLVSRKPMSNDRSGLNKYYTDLNEVHDRIKLTSSFVSAISSGRYYFDAENWATNKLYESDDISSSDFVSELLIRAYNHEGKSIPPQKPLLMLYDAGLACHIDFILAIEGIKAAKESGIFPVSVNISMEMLNDKVVMKEFTEVIALMNVNPKNIIIEALEDKCPEGANYLHLKEMKKAGYKFALDDFTNCANDWDRIDHLSELLDYIKIDGSMIEAYDNNKYNKFNVILDTLKDMMPNIEFVAERVKSEAQVKVLDDLGIKNSQGRELKPYFTENAINNSIPAIPMINPPGLLDELWKAVALLGNSLKESKQVKQNGTDCKVAFSTPEAI